MPDPNPSPDPLEDAYAAGFQECLDRPQLPGNRPLHDGRRDPLFPAADSRTLWATPLHGDRPDGGQHQGIVGDGLAIAIALVPR